MNSFQILFIQSVSDVLVLDFNFSREVADFIGCQFALESNYGISNIAKTQQNYCGMKIARTRISTQLGPDGRSQFAAYRCFKDCIIDFVLRMQYFKPITDDFKKLGCYQRFNEKSCYCPEKGYNARINNLYQQFKTYNNE